MLIRRLRYWLGSRKRAAALREEMELHLEEKAAELRETGLDEADARAEARRRFGNVVARREEAREVWIARWASELGQDLRYAGRTLRRSSGFAATFVAVLGLAIGASTAMFSVLNAVLLRPLPYESPEQLMMLWTEIPDQNLREGRSAWADFEQWREQGQSFADLAASDPASVTLTSEAGTEQISVLRVTPNLLSLLGVQPVRGRVFSVAEAEAREPVALIGHRFWQTHFGGSSEAVGATVELDGAVLQIIGILPEGPLFDADVWEPHTRTPDWDALRGRRGGGPWFVVGRLRPAVTMAQAQEEMNAIARRLDEASPVSAGVSDVSVTPLGLQVAGPRARLALWMLTGAVFCVLLVAAANVAGLSLARSVRREREIAVRAMLGASGARIVRQLLVESLMLAALSGLLGWWVAQAAVQLILVLQPTEVVRLNEVGLDAPALAWVLVMCLLTGVLVGLAPALALARRSLRLSNRAGERGVAGGVAMRKVRRALVVTEFALAVVLLVGAGLLMRSLWSIGAVDPGFRPARVLSAQVSTAPFTTTAGQRADFYERVLEEIEALPGVERAGIVGEIFIGSAPEVTVTVEAGLRPASERLRLRRDEVSAGFFEAVGAPLLAGRVFSAADGPDAPRVAIINEAMARRLWSGRDPLAGRFKFGAADSDSPWFTVVGVVGDMRRQGLESDPVPQMFEPLAQNSGRLATLLVRTSLEDPLEMAGMLPAAVGRVERYAPVYGVTTLENRLGGFLAERRFQTWLLLGFAAAALLMAAIGIYGLIQYSVATRTREIGIRLAVGAEAGEIFRLILREGLVLSLSGLAFGLVGAFGLGRIGANLLFGVTAADPWTFLAVSLLLAAVAAAASYWPARRAMRIDPMTALRQE